MKSKVTYNGLDVSENDKKRFDAKVKKVGECLEWTGTLRTGYGLIRLGSKVVSAHRLSYAIANGSVAERDVICHTCDNTKCVNPKHLYLGTNSTNMIDRSQRNRSHSNLTSELVTEAREVVFTIDEAKRFGAKHGLNYKTVISAVSGKTWGHLRTNEPHEVLNKREQGRSLSREQATELKKELFKRIDQWGIITHLAKKYGVSKSVVCDIKKGVAWKHIDVS